MRRLKRDNPVPEFRDWLLGTSAASERSCWPRSTTRNSPAASARRNGLRDPGALPGRAGAAPDGASGRALSRTAPGRSQLQGKCEETRSRREELLARQQGICKLCIASKSITSFRSPSPCPDSSRSCRPYAWSAIEQRRVWRATTAPTWRAASVATTT